MKQFEYKKDFQLNNVVVALGKFEGIHEGHKLLLNKAVSIAKTKGLTSVIFSIDMLEEKRIYLPEERKQILEALGLDIELVCPFTKEFASMAPEDFVKTILIDQLHAKYVIVGEDFRFGYKREGDVDRLNQYSLKYNFEVISYDKLTINNIIVSSSIIKEALSNGNIPQVSMYLGRDYSITGTVVTGKQLGRTIDFPTANILPSNHKIIPCDGAYETYVIIDNQRYTSITNVGTNPTVTSSNERKIETYILNFNKDIYNSELTVFFRRKLRDEMKFQNVGELKKQLNCDVQSVMHQ